MVDLPFSLPLWVLAVVLNIWLMGFALASLWALRRWVLPRLRITTDAALFFGAAAMQSGMALYGLVAALTAVSVWQKYSKGAYPQRERDAMREILRGYTKQIIEEAWPAQQQGRVPRAGLEWMDRLQAQLFAFEPRSESHKLLHAETLRAYNGLIEARRQRLDAVNTALPAVMWFVLLPGAMGCLLLSLFFRPEDARIQAILVAGLAGFVAMVLFVIIALDRPFRGAMAIPADSYQTVYDQLMKK